MKFVLQKIKSRNNDAKKTFLVVFSGRSTVTDLPVLYERVVNYFCVQPENALCIHKEEQLCCLKWISHFWLKLLFMTDTVSLRTIQGFACYCSKQLSFWLLKCVIWINWQLQFSGLPRINQGIPEINVGSLKRWTALLPPNSLSNVQLEMSCRKRVKRFNVGKYLFYRKCVCGLCKLAVRTFQLSCMYVLLRGQKFRWFSMNDMQQSCLFV